MFIYDGRAKIYALFHKKKLRRFLMKEIEQKLTGNIDRLTNKTIKFDERVGEGWCSAVYFLKTREIVEKKLPTNHVTMQFFQKDAAVLCGADEAIALLHTFADNPETLEIY